MKKIDFNIFSNINFDFKKLSIVLVVLFILLRLYLLQFPQSGKTEWKEIDYIQISKNYTKEEVQFWEPTITWPAEPPRVTAMEFPLVPYVASKLYNLFGFNVFTLRVITLICFMLFSIYLYKFVLLLTKNKSLAFITFFLSLTIPLNFIFGRLLFSGPAIITFILISIYNLLKWKMSDDNRYFIWSFIFFGLSLLLKPTSMYALLPLLYIYYSKTGNLNPKNYLRFGFAFLLAIIPSVIWYAYAYHLTQVSIDVFGVFGGHNKFQTFTKLSDPNWWQQIFGRLYELFGGINMFLIFIIGFFSGLLEKKFRLFYIIFIANLGYLFIIAEGHSDGPYRQFAFIAAGSFFIALGFIALCSIFYNLYKYVSSKIGFFPKLSPRFLYLAVLFLILVNFSYDLITKIPTKNYIHHERYFEIAKRLNNIKNKNSKIITTGNYAVEKGGNALCPILYHYADLQGWSLESEDWNLEKIKKLKSKGADIFVGMYVLTDEASDFNAKVQKKYGTLYKSKNYIICDLTKEKGQN